MNIVVNDYSLVGQFSNREDFIKSLMSSTMPILKEIKEKKFNLFKKTDFYNRSICYNETLYTVLFNCSFDPAIQLLKIFLVDLTRDEPFWDSDPLSPTLDDFSDYKCPYSNEYPSCFSEVHFRNAILLSFIHPAFEIEEFTICINDTAINIYNAYDSGSFSTHLSTFGISSPPIKNSLLICNDCQFEIRFNEDNHFIPHFHVKKGDSEISIKIFDLSTLAGSLPSNTHRDVLYWARCNINRIKNIWNYYHPEKQIY
jgi:hypothetical protein